MGCLFFYAAVRRMAPGGRLDFLPCHLSATLDRVPLRGQDRAVCPYLTTRADHPRRIARWRISSASESNQRGRRCPDVVRPGRLGSTGPALRWRPIRACSKGCPSPVALRARFVVSSPWTARSKLATSARPIEATARAPKARDDVLAHKPCELIPGADLGCVRPDEALGGIRNGDAVAARIAHLGACPACLSERRGGIAADDGTCDIRPPQPCLPAGRADAKDQAGGSRVDDVPPPGRGELDGADRCVRKGALVESLLCHCALCRFSVPMRQTLHLVEGRARPYKNGCFPRFLQRFVDRGVAQSGRASALGAEGRWFESSLPDQFCQ